MNKKIFGIIIALLAVSLMLTPLAIAKPGAEKSNDKWQSFELRIVGSGETGKSWQTPPEPADPKTEHSRDNVWAPATVLSLTVIIDGTEIYDYTSSPTSLDYYALLDANNNIGKRQLVTVKETIRFMDGETELGTLELQVSDFIPDGDFTAMRGTFVGVGTGVLKGVKVIGTDSLELDPFAVVRSGTVMNWPGLP